MTKRAWKALGILLAVLLLGSIAVAAEQPPNPEPEPINTLRVYGKGTANANFPYETYQGPFDLTSPEAPPKDFVQWNPAFLDHSEFFRLRHAVGSDANEKVHLRQWYVPKYCEPSGLVWTDQDLECQPEIVLEYTYLLLDADNNNPVAGLPGEIQFLFPVADNSNAAEGGQLGLDHWDYTGGDEVRYTLVNELKQEGDKFWMDMSTEEFNVEVGDEISFLDHRIKIKFIQGSWSNGTPGIQMDVYYNGNMDWSGDDLAQDIIVLQGETLSAGRHVVNVESDTSWVKPVTEPWYVKVKDVFGQNSANIVVGRLMTEGEAFFVDGVEYEVAKIFSPDGENFKYITIRNGLPKYDDVYLDRLTILKRGVQEEEPLPFLPPYNMTHDIVDDVNNSASVSGPDVQSPDNVIDEACLPTGYGAESNIRCDVKRNVIAERIVQGVDSALAFFIAEEKEGRFDTNLLEEKFTHPGGDWRWINIETQPWSYTEFVLPEIEGNTLGDYILVSSFITEDSKEPWTTWCDSTDPDPDANKCDDKAVRVKFDYDATVGKIHSADVYVNDAEYNLEHRGYEANSLRVYGEEDLNAAFPYDTFDGPFNLKSFEAPPKDFIVFNPAWHSNLEGIFINDQNAHQKVHLRQWYVPEYTEPAGYVWREVGQFTPQTQAEIVKEYTYLLLDKDNNPLLGKPGKTRFLFPIKSSVAQIGLDDYGLVRLEDMGLVDEEMEIQPDDRFYGERFVDLSTGDIAVKAGDRIQFLDHEIEITQIDSMGTGPRVQGRVYYIGNDLTTARSPEYLGLLNVPYPDKGSAGRGVVENLAPEVVVRPWYIEVGAALGSETAKVKIGRLLMEGESFFVNGAEYGVAKLGGHFGGDDDALLYITLRNGLPKYDEVEIAGLTIWKTPVQEGENLPFLPPFNQVHTMVDDTNIPTKYQILTALADGPDLQGADNVITETFEGPAFPPGSTLGWGKVSGIHQLFNTIAKRAIPNVPPIEEYFIAEEKEPRFDTNLMEEKFIEPEIMTETSGAEFLVTGNDVITQAGPVELSNVDGTYFDESCDPQVFYREVGDTDWILSTGTYDFDVETGIVTREDAAFPDEYEFGIVYCYTYLEPAYEQWQWINIETNPMAYTEFVLPERPNKPAEYGLNILGDYILVSSWMTEDSDEVWSDEYLTDSVRMKFVYDAEDGTGIYVNTYEPVEPPTPPVCEAPNIVTDTITATPMTQLLGEAITFSATGEGTEPLTYEWDFNSDGIVDATTTDVGLVQHTYGQTGSFIVTLTLSNECSDETDTAQVTVKVVDCEPVELVSLTADEPVYLTQTMNFTAMVTGDTPISYMWDFGDGSDPVSGDATAEHQFPAIGTYTVELTVSNLCADLEYTDSKSIDVEVITIDGDVNGDCTVNILDVQLMVENWFSRDTDPDWDPTFDVTGQDGEPDGVVNVLDVQFVVNRMGTSCPE